MIIIHINHLSDRHGTTITLGHPDYSDRQGTTIAQRHPDNMNSQLDMRLERLDRLGVFRDIIRPQQGVSNTGISKLSTSFEGKRPSQLDMRLGRRTFIGLNLTKSTTKI